MSAIDQFKAVQTACGLSGDQVDGVPGPRSDAAYQGARAAAAAEYREGRLPKRAEGPLLLPDDGDEGGRVDDRSESQIARLHPKVRPLARALIRNAAADGIVAKVTSGLRTYEEQNELYAQGRSRPGKIVTNAPAGHSNHNFGLAFDLTIFDGANPIWESPKYKTLGRIGKALGLTWGGDWASINDEPHFELRPQWAAEASESQMLAELRSRHESGRDAFA